MLRKDFILCKTRNLLREFMAPIIAHTDKPRQKFLPQAVGAMLLKKGRSFWTVFWQKSEQLFFWTHKKRAADACSQPTPPNNRRTSRVGGKEGETLRRTSG
jgi:hypothetical protein